jgi:hypothetical protein
MIRTQISLHADDYAQVKREARELGISVAEFVRRAVRNAVPSRDLAAKPWMEFAGLIESGDPRSSDSVDKIVYGTKA